MTPGVLSVGAKRRFYDALIIGSMMITDYIQVLFMFSSRISRVIFK